MFVYILVLFLIEKYVTGNTSRARAKLGLVSKTCLDIKYISLKLTKDKSLIRAKPVNHVAIFPKVAKHIKVHLILVRNSNERRRPSQETLAIRTKLTDDLTRQKTKLTLK